MNNHESWLKCAKCQIFYDIRIDITCPNCFNMKLNEDEIKRFKEFRNIMLAKKIQMYAEGNFNAVCAISDLIQQFSEINEKLKTNIENEKIKF